MPSSACGVSESHLSSLHKKGSLSRRRKRHWPCAASKTPVQRCNTPSSRPNAQRVAGSEPGRELWPSIAWATQSVAYYRTQAFRVEPRSGRIRTVTRVVQLFRPPACKMGLPFAPAEALRPLSTSHGFSHSQHFRHHWTVLRAVLTLVTPLESRFIVRGDVVARLTGKKLYFFVEGGVVSAISTQSRSAISQLMLDTGSVLHNALILGKKRPSLRQPIGCIG